MQTERQQEIIETALYLISTKGIQGLTIKNISKEIGITEPAIYRHFESKIDILTTLLDSFKQRSADLYSKDIDPTDSAVDKIDKLFSNHFNAFTEMPSLTSVIFSEEIFRNETSLREKVNELIEYNNQILTAIIVGGQNDLEIRNDVQAKNLALMVMGSLRIFVKKWQLSEFSFDLQQEGREMIKMIKKLIVN